MTGRTPTRADDERLLTMIRLRCNGIPLRQIGARFGITATGVDKVIRKARDADFAESGEPIQAVDRAYWREGRW